MIIKIAVIKDMPIFLFVQCNLDFDTSSFNVYKLCILIFLIGKMVFIVFYLKLTVKEIRRSSETNKQELKELCSQLITVCNFRLGY